MKRLSRIVLWLAVLGLNVPHVTIASAAEQDPTASHTPVTTPAVITDVALTEDGFLCGQVVDRAGHPAAQTPLSIATGGRAIGQTTTDQQGRFAVRVMRGGVYVLTTADHNPTVMRVWTRNSAPPSANREVLVVSGQQLTRGYYGGDWLTPANVAGVMAIMGVVAVSVIGAIHLDDDAS